MTKIQSLQLRQKKLKDQISDSLDLLIGSVHKTPSQAGYHLTTKVKGKSVTKYVRKDQVKQVKTMTRNHLKVRELMRQISRINWQLLLAQQDKK